MQKYCPRYRGPLEYDKFMITLIQDIIKLKEFEEDISLEASSLINKEHNRINEIFEITTSPNSKQEKLILNILKKEGLNGYT